MPKMAAKEQSDWSRKVNKVRKILIKPGGKASMYFLTARAGKYKNTKNLEKL